MINWLRDARYSCLAACEICRNLGEARMSILPRINDDTRVQALVTQWAERHADWELPSSSSFSQQLSVAFCGSDYVAQQSLKAPEMLRNLAESGCLDRAYQPGEMASLLGAALAEATTEDSLMKQLRLFRREQMVRIIWRDLNQIAPLNETLEDLSELADCSVQAALERLDAWAQSQFGQPRDAEGGPQQLLVMGMGKLGARELNLSSDIDLIFMFGEHGQTDGARVIPNEQYFTQLGRKLINVLGKVTADGFVFRVDMRLRPFGEAGPLSLTLDAFENYCLSHARDWERYAMVKGRALTGRAEDIERLNSIQRPFVFRRYLDFGAIEAIRDMKRRIQNEMHKRGMDANVKLGRGGIREIEFIGQSFQLVHGGRDADLQIRPIQQVLALLAAKNMLPANSVKELLSAYEFLRFAENRIQAWKDEQTHLLPADEQGRARLAGMMGFGQWQDFIQALDGHRKRVDALFSQVFSTPHREQQQGENPLSQVWHGLMDEDAEARALADAGFEDVSAVSGFLTAFRGSSSCRLLTQSGRAKLDALVPLLLEAAGQSGAPDLCTERLSRLLQAIARRTSYLDLLLENPLVISQLVRLAAASGWVVEQIIRHPLLLDELLDPRRLYAPLRRSELDKDLGAQLARLPLEDLEQQMEVLRKFADGNKLRTAAADLTGVIPIMVVSDYLTEIAEVTLKHVLALSWAHLAAKHGIPRLADGSQAGFAIIGYGKLGGIELGYGSDLDMVFLHQNYPSTAMTDGAKPIANDQFFARLGQRVLHLLTTRTPSGLLYEADMRLRPNGNSGLLVSSLESFSLYQEERAWVWEHQALVRARPVAGDAEVVSGFEQIRTQVLCKARDPDGLRGEVCAMRSKMRASLDKSSAEVFDLKQGLGGIADIEFMVQYCVLNWAHQHPGLSQWSDNIRTLQTLAELGLVAQDQAQQLADAYRALRSAYHRAALQGQPGQVPATELTTERANVAAIWLEWMNCADAPAPTGA